MRPQPTGKTDFAKRLRRNGRTIVAVARGLGLHRNTVSNWVRGINKPSHLALRLLASTFPDLAP